MLPAHAFRFSQQRQAWHDAQARLERLDPPRPPMPLAGLTVERAAAGDGDVLLLEGVDERRVVHQLDALPSGEHHGQVVVRVLAEQDRGARGPVQVDVVEQFDGAGQPLACR